MTALNNSLVCMLAPLLPPCCWAVNGISSHQWDISPLARGSYLLLTTGQGSVRNARSVKP